MASIICPRCAFTRRALPIFRRTLSTTPSVNAGSTPTKQASPAATTTSDQSASTTPNPALSTPSVAQPFSTPGTPSASTAAPSAPKQPTVTSSTPAGKILKGLNYHKNRDDPIALPDAEYPPWLWTLLEPKTSAAATGADGREIDPRLFAKSANVRRKANKRAREAEAERGGALRERSVPLHEQSVDLPEGEGAGGARVELTRSMRVKRRGQIKEKNFLKEMS